MLSANIHSDVASQLQALSAQSTINEDQLYRSIATKLDDISQKIFKSLDSLVLKLEICQFEISTITLKNRMYRNAMLTYLNNVDLDDEKCNEM